MHRDVWAVTLRWSFVWPGITTNHLYATVRGRRVLVRRAVAWREGVIVQIRQECIDRCERLQLPPGKLAFQIDYWPPDDKRKHDPSGLTKLTEDSVFAAFQTDDEAIWSTTSTRHEPDGCPRLVVEIRAMRETT